MQASSQPGLQFARHIPMKRSNRLAELGRGRVGAQHAEQPFAERSPHTGVKGNHGRFWDQSAGSFSQESFDGEARRETLEAPDALEDPNRAKRILRRHAPDGFIDGKTVHRRFELAIGVLKQVEKLRTYGRARANRRSRLLPGMALISRADCCIISMPVRNRSRAVKFAILSFRMACGDIAIGVSQRQRSGLKRRPLQSPARLARCG